MQATLSKRQLKSSRARSQVVEAALVLISAKGFVAMSMADLSCAAGFSKAGVYHHFLNKEAVLAAVIYHLGEQGLLWPPLTESELVTVLTQEGVEVVIFEIWIQARVSPIIRQLLFTYAPQGWEYDRVAILEMGNLVQKLVIRDFQTKQSIEAS